MSKRSFDIFDREDRSMPKKVKLSFLSLCTFLLLLCCVLLSSCSSKSKGKQIEVLSYEASSFGVIGKAAVINFEERSQKIFINEAYRKGGRPNEIDQIPDKSFETYKIKNVEQFRKKIKTTNVDRWQKKYIDTRMMDGLQWNIKIQYTDQTSKTIYGSNDAPKEMEELEQLLFDSNN